MHIKRAAQFACSMATSFVGRGADIAHPVALGNNGPQPGGMGADLSIDFEDGGDGVWIPFAPHSWLTNYWGPEAKRQGWNWVELACGNVCQIDQVEDVSELLEQVHALRLFVEKTVPVEPRIREAMLERIDLARGALTTAIAVGDRFRFLSIG